jgi:hypothetical protein
MKMAKSVQELEQIVKQLNRDLIEWQKFCCALRQHIEEFKTWTINEINALKSSNLGAGNNSSANAMDAKVARRLKSIQRDLDIIAAEQLFG